MSMSTTAPGERFLAGVGTSRKSNLAAGLARRVMGVGIQPMIRPRAGRARRLNDAERPCGTSRALQIVTFHPPGEPI